MKAIILCILVTFLINPNDMKGQVTVYKARYKAYVVDRDNNTLFNGYLVSLGDSSLFLTEKKKLAAPIDLGLLQEYRIPQIHTLKFRSRSSAWKRTLIGALAGATLGAVAGFIAGDDEPPPPGAWLDRSYTAEEKALGLGTVMIIPGALTGLAVGFRKKKFPVNFSPQQYDMVKPELEKYEMKSYNEKRKPGG